MIVVALVIFLFLLHVRSALVPILTLPLGVLLAFIPMAFQHLTANIMSLGGIAIAIGAMVDASIIMIENIHKKLDDWERGEATAAGRARRARRPRSIAAMQEVGPSIFFSLLVITVSFLPVFTLEGAEGRLFKPLAFTKTYSMGVRRDARRSRSRPRSRRSSIRGKILGEDRHPVNRVLMRALRAGRALSCVRHRRHVIARRCSPWCSRCRRCFAARRASSCRRSTRASLLYMPTAPPGMSIAEASRVLQQMDRELRSVPRGRDACSARTAAPRRRPIRRRSAWSRPPSCSGRATSGGPA